MKITSMIDNYVRENVINFINKYVFSFVYTFNFKLFFNMFITTTMFSEIFTWIISVTILTMSHLKAEKYSLSLYEYQNKFAWRICQLRRYYKETK